MTVYHFEKEEVEKCACGCAVPGKGIHGVVAVAALILKQFPSQILIGCYPWTDEEIVCIYLFKISIHVHVFVHVCTHAWVVCEGVVCVSVCLRHWEGKRHMHRVPGCKHKRKREKQWLLVCFFWYIYHWNCESENLLCVGKNLLFMDVVLVQL